MAEPRNPGEQPLVSVVLPTYGRSERHLREAVDSVRAQTYDNVELLVVDDSPGELSASLAAGDLALTRLTGRDHRGAGDARNTGIWRADGRYLAFLDDDDTWHPEKLTRQVARLEESPEVGVVYTALEYVRDGDGRRLDTSAAATTGDVTRALLEGANLGTFSTLLVDGKLVPRAGLVDPRFPVLEDREWCLRLSRHCRFASVTDPLVQYRRGDHDQLTDGFRELRDTVLPLFERKHRPLAASYGPDCERRFRAALRRSCALAAMSSGEYGQARRYALAALRFTPTDRQSWAYLAAAAGGRYTYRPLRAARRWLSARTG